MANTYNVCNKLQAIADAITQGGGGGGGTTVIANPTGTPTADLNTVQIGQTIYDIPGGGGGGGSAYRENIIFTGSSSNTSPITLSANINNYDLLQFVVSYTDHKVTGTYEIPVDYFVNNYSYTNFTDIYTTDNISLTLAGGEWFRIARGQTDTQLQYLTQGGSFYLKSVIGIKLPRGAGSDEAVDINYNNTTSGLTAINVQDAIDENADSISTLNSKIVGGNVLWTNQNPSSATFAAQTIELANSNYNYLLVLYRYRYNDNHQVSFMCEAGSSGIQGYSVTGGAGGVGALVRPITITDSTHLSVSDCTYYYNGTKSTTNDFMIPYKVFGL